MLWPDGSTTRPQISSPFGPRSGGAFSVHYGADLIGYSTVRAAGSGTVTFAGWLNDAAGNTVVIDLGGGVSELHMHLGAIDVSRGRRVSAGDALGPMGSSGNATGDCDHYEIRIHGTSVDPIPYTAARLSAAGGSTTPATPSAPSHPFQEDEMPATYINIQGKADHHRGGTFAIMRDNAGKLFARFVSPSITPGVPTVPNEEYAAWANTMPIK